MSFDIENQGPFCVAGERYPSLGNLEFVESSQLLPSLKAEKRDKSLVQLLYLTLLNDDRSTQSPFKEKEERCFERNKWFSARAARWLDIRWAALPFIIGSGISAAAVFAPLVTTSIALQILFGFSAAFAGGTALSYESLYITGRFTDASSTAQDREQDAIVKIKIRYHEMAKELLALNKEDHDFAVLIATHLNIEKIRSEMSRYIPLEAKKVVAPLEEVRGYLVEGKKLQSYDLQMIDLICVSRK